VSAPDMMMLQALLAAALIVAGLRVIRGRRIQTKPLDRPGEPWSDGVVTGTTAVSHGRWSVVLGTFLLGHLIYRLLTA
jgi:hypothetical protein